MKRAASHGFTIIEVMLFLAITGLLAVGVLATVGASINAQRYRDAVVTFQTEVQSLYSDVNNVYNDRGGEAIEGCAAIDGGASLFKGQSTCVVLGKIFSVNPSGEITKATVIGSDTAATEGTDLAVLRSYSPVVYEESTETSSLEWDTRISWPSSGAGARQPSTPRELTLLVLRSPESGAVYTFSFDGTLVNPDTTELQSFITEAQNGNIGGRSARTICIDPNGIIAPDNSALYINRHAATATAIETRSNELMRELGGSGASQC